MSTDMIGTWHIMHLQAKEYSPNWLIDWFLCFSFPKHSEILSQVDICLYSIYAKNQSSSKCQFVSKTARTQHSLLFLYKRDIHRYSRNIVTYHKLTCTCHFRMWEWNRKPGYKFKKSYDKWISSQVFHYMKRHIKNSKKFVENKHLKEV